MRSRFDEQLTRLNAEIIDMGTLIEHAIEESVQALSSRDVVRARKIIALDREVDQKEREVENQCLKLLLQQQPVARDLRFISAALKMITDMERIGDQAADIAEITRFLNGQHDSMSSQIPLKEMSASTIKMVSDSIDSFVKKDLALAGQVIAYDDVIDDYFNRIKANLIGLIRLSPRKR